MCLYYYFYRLLCKWVVIIASEPATLYAYIGESIDIFLCKPMLRSVETLVYISVIVGLSINACVHIFYYGSWIGPPPIICLFQAIEKPNLDGYFAVSKDLHFILKYDT
jgi:hypothetical protein